jgi:hypothetical protein
VSATHAALGYAFSLDPAPQLAELVDAAFAALRSPGATAGTCHRVADPRELDDLVTTLNAAAISSRPDALRLHAAVVARGPHALLLVGGSGAGKSTLTLAAVQAGWDYLSDEVAALDREALTVEAYPKPLTLKAGTQALLPELSPYSPQPTPSGASWQVAPDRVRPGCALAPGERRAVVGIVLIGYDADAAAGLVVPTQGEAVVELAQQTAYLGHLDRPLDAVIALTERLPVRRLVHGDARRAVGLLDGLLP